MKTLKPISDIRISDEYLLPYLTRNADTLLLNEWQQMNDKGYLDNFKIAGMNTFGFYRGSPDADAGVHDWARTALIVSERKETGESARNALNHYLEEYIHLVTAAQDENGYLYTYKQICEPSKKWQNLYGEREWLCMGAFIETAVTHFRITGKRELLNGAEKCADMFLAEFGRAEDSRTAAFSRMERALFLLGETSGNERFTCTAGRLLERRTRQKAPGCKILREALRMKKAEKEIKKKQLKLLNKEYPILTALREIFPEDRKRNRIRTLKELLTGEAVQLKPGKSVFDRPHGCAENYVALLRAYLAAPGPDAETLSALEKLWNEIILHYTYITGGIGSNVLTGSFGKPDELPADTSCASPESAYEMLAFSAELYRKTGRLFYLDFCEWIFFNLILASVNTDKDRFFSRHLHESHGGFGRKENPIHPAAPVAVSAALALFPETVLFTDDEHDIYIDQYPALEAFSDHPKVSISVKTFESDSFRSEIKITKQSEEDVTVFLRIPGWAMGYRITLNGKELDSMPNIRFGDSETVPHYFNGNRFPVPLPGKGTFTIITDFPKIVRNHYPTRTKKKKTDADLFAVSRGKFLYCAEEADNRHCHFEELNLNAMTDFHTEKSYDFFSSLIIDAKDIDGNRVRLIPFHLWNNRGNGKMKIWLKNKTKEEK